MWDGIKSEYFGALNGVILFSLYIDPLLNILSKSCYGYHIRCVYSGVLSYVNDITIICQSIGGLNDMLQYVIICN